MRCRELLGYEMLLAKVHRSKRVLVVVLLFAGIFFFLLVLGSRTSAAFAFYGIEGKWQCSVATTKGGLPSLASRPFSVFDESGGSVGAAAVVVLILKVFVIIVVGSYFAAGERGVAFGFNGKGKSGWCRGVGSR